MKPHLRILTGTALASLMASASAYALPLPNASMSSSATPVLLAQAEEKSLEELIPEALEKADPAPQPEAAPAPEPAPAAAPAPQPEPAAPEPVEQPVKKHHAPKAEPAPEPEAAAPAPQPEPQPEPAASEPVEPPVKKHRAPQPEAAAPEPEAVTPAPQAEPAAPEPVEQPVKKHRKPQPEAASPEPEAVTPAPQAEPASPEPVEQPVKKHRKPQPETAAPEPEVVTPAPQAEPAAPEPVEQPVKHRKPEAAAPEPVAPAAAPEEKAPAAAPVNSEGASEQKPTRRPRPSTEEGAQPSNEAAPAKQSSQPAPQQPAAEVAPNDGAVAPLLDSQKRQRGGQNGDRKGRRDQSQPAAPAAPPPSTDAAAQQAAQPKQVESVLSEKGKRREGSPDGGEQRRRERPRGSEVVKEFGDRSILEHDGQVMVESSDRPRLSNGARDVYVEDLPHGRTRETIVRRNGVKVVTIRNADGDVIRRSRILPDGREVVLGYVDERNYDHMKEWRDPGDDLPPMRLDIPADDYILDAARVRKPDDYYRFLEKPPVERVERLYSIDEVKRSARIRDKIRRIDLDTLTFDTGSAEVGGEQVRQLRVVADAMNRLLEKNPAETFLLEGHTDAVGSDLANLALSDRRAESVARSLTDIFDIPPENLVTQGYGEQYLKVRTQAPERENRRVAIRRITPLVAPVASRK